MNKTHWKKLENPDYLGSYAFVPGQNLVAQIKSVGQEDVYNPSSKSKETCTVAHFTNPAIKPMILNVTNCKTIHKLYDTPFIEDWAGKYIEIYVAKVKAFGEVVEALRIKPSAPSIEKITCKDCGCIVKPAAGKTARELADLALKNCGRELCLACMKVEKARMDAEQKE